MNALPVTYLVAGIFAISLVVLSFQISLRRIKLKVRFGDAGDETLQRRIRAHGNFIEYAPFALIVLGLIEYRGTVPWLVCLLGGAFVLSRVVHALGILFTSTPAAQAMAMMINHAAFLTAGFWLIGHV